MAEEDRPPAEKFWTPARILATAVVVVLITTIGYTLFGGHTEVEYEPQRGSPWDARVERRCQGRAARL